MTLGRRLLLILVVLVSCVGCDQASKSYADANLPKAEALVLLAGMVRLQVTHNEGAFLGLGSSLAQPWREALCIGGAGILLAALLAYAAFAGAARRPSGRAYSIRRTLPLRRVPSCS